VCAQVDAEELTSEPLDCAQFEEAMMHAQSRCCRDVAKSFKRIREDSLLERRSQQLQMAEGKRRGSKPPAKRLKGMSTKVIAGWHKDKDEDESIVYVILIADANTAPPTPQTVII